MQALQSACEELAEQWTAQRQPLTAALDTSLQSNSSGGSCPAADAAMLSALAWAEAVVERCAVVDARTGRAAITEISSAIPQVRPLLLSCCLVENFTFHSHLFSLYCSTRALLHVAAA